VFVFVALDIQHAMCMRHISTVASQLYNIFPHYFNNGKILGEKIVMEHKMCVLIFSTNLLEIFLILRRRERDVIKMSVGLPVQSPKVILVRL
jgi:hypothetical protein